MAETKAKFIILRKMKYGEADLIIHALSAQGGKFSFIARSALRSKKRFGGGVLEPSHFVLLTYKAAAELGKLNVLNEAQIIQDFAGIRRSYDSLQLALHVLECIYKITQEGDEHSEGIFNLTGHMLKTIAVSEHLEILRMQFHLKLLLQQGVLTPEPWMSQMLRVAVADHQQLLPQWNEIKDKSGLVELSVREYIERAETDFFSTQSDS